MTTVTIITGGLTGDNFTKNGITFYRWSYTVNVDGQVGVFDYWVDTNNPADEAWVQSQVINDLTNDPDGLGGGIADGATDDSSDGVVAADGADGGSTDGSDGDGGDGGGGGGDSGGGGIIGESA